MPFRVHPLWYSPIIPILFLLSAIGLGLMMVVFESTVSSWLYRKEHETDILSGLGRAAVWVLGLYVVVKFADLAFQNKLHLLVDGSWESAVFLFEMAVSAVIPAALLSFKKINRSRAGLSACALMVVFGFVLNRISASGIATIRATGSDYIPSLMEIAISLWVVSSAILVFLFFVENFRFYEKEAGDKPPQHARPEFDRPSVAWADESLYASFKRYSLMFAFGAVFAYALLPYDALHG
ncbi:NrfD/PsrC family molybdoenzyme membrane anchor subunit, partial [candidate division KSB1 bacterium]